MNRLILPLFLGAALATNLPAHAKEGAAPPSPDLAEFAFSLSLTPKRAVAVERALLPTEVYQSVAHADLADLRVFNQRGEVVPHALWLDVRQVSLARAPKAVPVFPIRTAAEETAEDPTVTLQVELDGQGKVVSIGARQLAAGSGPSDGPEAKERVSAYVLHTAALEEDLSALRIELEPTPKDYVLPLIVEASDDLASFRVVNGDAALVKLAYGDHAIVHDRVELRAGRPRYLRLRWPKGELPAEIRAVHAEFNARAENAGELKTVKVAGSRAGEPGLYTFDLGGLFPVERVRVALPEENTLVEAELRSSEVPSGPQATRHRGALYRVTQGGRKLESPALELPRTTHRYWQLTVDAKGGGLGTQNPELEVLYRPHELLFLARGEGPYELGFGHHAHEPSSFSPSEILALLPEAERRSPRVDTVTLGTRSTRAGLAALTAPPPPRPTRTYVLWAVLISGTLLLGGVAFRLSHTAKVDAAP